MPLMGALHDKAQLVGPLALGTPLFPGTKHNSVAIPLLVGLRLSDATSTSPVGSMF